MSIFINIRSVFYQNETETLCKELISAINNDNGKLIRDRNFNVNAPLAFEDGDLPLIYAMKQRKLEAVKALLAKGADPALPDKNGLTASECAHLIGDEQLFLQILQHITQKNIESIDNAFASPEKRLEIQQTVDELRATYSTRSKEYSSLVNQVLNDDEMSSPDDNQLIFHHAVFSGSTDLLKECLALPKYKGLINQADNFGRTPLHYAAALQRFDLMQVLCSANADIQAKDHRGLTPVFFIAAGADKHHPLTVDNLSSLVFLATVAMWGTNLFLLKNIDWDIIQKINMVGEYAKSLQYWNSFSTWSGLLASASLDLAVMYALPDNVRLTYQALKIAAVAFSALNGVSSCWKNRSLGAIAALKKAVVVELPKFVTIGQWIHRVGASYSLWDESQSDQTLEKLRRVHRRLDAEKVDFDDTPVQFGVEDGSINFDGKIDESLRERFTTVAIDCVDPSSENCTIEKEKLIGKVSTIFANEAQCFVGSRSFKTVPECQSKLAEAFTECMIDPESLPCEQGAKNFVGWTKLVGENSSNTKYCENILDAGGEERQSKECLDNVVSSIATCAFHKDACKTATADLKAYMERSKYFEATFPSTEILSKDTPIEKIDYYESCFLSLNTQSCVKAENAYKQFVVEELKRKEESHFDQSDNLPKDDQLPTVTLFRRSIWEATVNVLDTVWKTTQEKADSAWRIAKDQWDNMQKTIEDSWEQHKKNWKNITKQSSTNWPKDGPLAVAKQLNDKEFESLAKGMESYSLAKRVVQLKTLANVKGSDDCKVLKLLFMRFHPDKLHFYQKQLESENIDYSSEELEQTLYTASHVIGGAINALRC